jgi:RNA polymerase sigma factor (TIGR02999 family)
MAEASGAITVLLRQWQDGDKEAESQLFQLLMPDLRKIAGRCFRGERPGHTFQPTALVNEAFLRLVAAKHIDWQNRGHFLAISARVMRRLLIDHARSRPSVQFAPIDGIPLSIANKSTPVEWVVALDLLLEEMEAESHERRVIVELKFGLGLTDSETAKVLNMSQRNMQRQWHIARRWLYERLSDDRWTSLSKTMNR